MPNTDVRKLTLIQTLIIVLAAILMTACTSTVPTTVKTPLGSIEGYEEAGVRYFLGIPYAQSTASENRWKAPLPMNPWSGTLKADEFGPWCAQMDFERQEEGHRLSAEGWTIFMDVPADESSQEDCLSLNVFAPASSDTPKPVVVFFHGNGLGTSFPMYDGSEMARSDIVFVSANYRLLSMGIFAHPAITAASGPNEPLGRYSEMDRIAALQWVQQNVSAFGGDPSQVTVMGSSEGGAAILQMLSNPEVEGLFHQAIVQSGNGWWEPLSHDEHEQLGCELASYAGLDGCNATLSELQNLDWTELPITGPFTIDNRTYAIGASEAIDSNRVIDVPLLIGWNDFDGSSLRFTPDELIEHTHPDVLAQYATDLSKEDLAYEIYTDLHSGAPARWVASELQDGAPTYLYMYSYVVSWDEGDVRGAEHAYELPHILGTWDKTIDDVVPFLSKILIGDEDEAMSAIMHQCWVSFIKTGAPSCPNAPEWPPYSRNSDQLMELNLEPKVLTGFRAKQLDAQEAHKEHYFQRVRDSINEVLNNGLN